MYSSDNETSCTSASEDIGSEDTPEEMSEFELDFSSSSTSSSAASSAARSGGASSPSSAASSPRRSPRLQKKRSRIVEKEASVPREALLAQRRSTLSPSHQSQDLPPESSVGRISPSLTSTRSCTPSLPPSRSSPVCWESPAAGAAGQRCSASHHHHHQYHHHQQGRTHPIG
ncbi:hypothetical protein CEXT_782681 [Caerostris extrusa]|uniref:Uncharacterized protein n=1 Tax=Caerostris extrusa TaxID=172846 RepID=A0AAV4VCJ6_CAEEX|nr:hypothetical protein CEXT_782681 [Caerostris extrusa]